jgi:hypothetical protein
VLGEKPFESGNGFGPFSSSLMTTYKLGSKNVNLLAPNLIVLLPANLLRIKTNLREAVQIKESV